MPFSFKKLKEQFTPESRHKKLEARLQKKLADEQSKTERYLAQQTETQRIAKLKKDIEAMRTERGQKKRRVKIGGYTFEV